MKYHFVDKTNTKRAFPPFQQHCLKMSFNDLKEDEGVYC